MKKNEIFTKYELEELQPEELQFELMEMPSFFYQTGNAHKEPHIHTFYQIIWFRKGVGKHYVDFKEYPIKDNTLYFISPGQIHCFDQSYNYEGVIVHFNESFLSDEGTSENVFLKYNVFNAFDTVPYYYIATEDEGRLHFIVEQMKIEMENNRAFAHKDYLKYLVKMFLISVQRMGERGIGVPLCPNNTANRTFVRFRQLLEHHYREQHTVKAYADRLGVSTKTLTNAVFDSAHTTPLKVINERIVLEAKRQLIHSDLKVKEIAFYLGFEDPSYFVKFFKRQTGFLPIQFRKLHSFKDEKELSNN